MLRTFLIAVAVTTSPQVGYGQFRKVILTGDDVSTRAGLQPLSVLGDAELNDQASVAILGRTADGIDGYWLRQPGMELKLVSQDGDPAPINAGGAVFDHDWDDSWIGLNNRNEVLIGTDAQADIRFGGTWIAGPQNGLSLIHQERGPAFGFSPGSVYGDADSITFTDGGVAFSSFVHDANVEEGSWGIYWWQDGRTELLARDGDVVPAVPQERTLQVPEHTTANRDGRVVVSEFGSTQGQPIPPGLWTFAANAERAPRDVLQGEGDQFLPPSPLQLFANFVSEDETVYFSGNFAGNEQGYWKSDENGLTPVIVTGDSLDGGIVTAVLDLQADDTGDVAYLAGRTLGVESRGIWKERDGQTLLVARTGTLAPDVDERFSTILGFEMNQRGQIAMTALTAGGPYRGIWAEDPTGELRLIMRENELFDVGGGDLRQIQSVGLEGINDDGLILLRARFDDGSAGYFTSDIVAVPEPTSFAMLVSAILAIAYRRRQNRL